MEKAAAAEKAAAEKAKVKTVLLNVGCKNTNTGRGQQAYTACADIERDVLSKFSAKKLFEKKSMWSCGSAYELAFQDPSQSEKQNQDALKQCEKIANKQKCWEKLELN